MTRMVLSCVLACAVCSCAAEDESVREIDAVEIEGTVYLTTDSGDLSIGIEDSMCSCQSQACDQKWVETHLGCNVCLVVLCADGAPTSLDGRDPADVDFHGACVYCPDLANSVIGG